MVFPIRFTFLRKNTPVFLKRFLKILANTIYLLLGWDYYQNRKEIVRLQSLSRYETCFTDLLGKPLQLVDAASFLSAYNAIFEREIYRFVSTCNIPTILDCGANTGLAIIYWKKLYPNARITAFEPDPKVFGALRLNCEQWQLTDVELVNKAVWNSKDIVRFKSDCADAGRVVGMKERNFENIIKVPTVPLKDYLKCPIELLKLDIEGAEIAVLQDCSDNLRQINHLFVEFHSFIDKKQHLDAILKILLDADFRIHIQPELVSPLPFVKRLNSLGMDQRLNIFAYR